MQIKDIDNATLEAIYWWNRDEHYYHYYFSKLPIIYNDKPLLNFFTTKIFEVFLREYAIRRNLSSGVESVNRFIDELFEFKFVDAVIDGNTIIVDEISENIKQKGNSTKRQTKSLLSKVAFLINPHKFSLYDNLAKQSLWKLKKNGKEFNYKEIETYSGFLKQTTILRKEVLNTKLFDNATSILKHFEGTSSYDFFSKNSEAFQMRIVDKYLWLTGQEANGRKYSHQEYIKLNSM